jgi:glyoxylase-like metal-dependent hydrolase (beta-lactamase superfamily II)
MDRLRRRLLEGAVAGGVSLALGPSPAAARMEKAGRQASGVHRMQVGSFELTSLSDGYTLMDHRILAGDQELINILTRAAHLPDGPIKLSVNAFLVNTGDALILIDSGAGNLMLPSMGRLPESLAAAGVDPALVDQVLITHMHGDHVGGTVTPDRKMLFPNAVVRMGRADYTFWTSEAEMDRAQERKVRFVASRLAASVYGERMQPFDPGAQIVPGIRALDTAGHTPGHSSYLIESGDRRVLATGDLLHAAPVQFSRPEITVDYDSDHAIARRMRRRILDQAIAEDWLLAIPHAPFPGLGYVRRDGASYLFDPLPWQMF